jgi:L,D-peptidoglycan transpeptidase YkuD (ErfK/YbiS/YcfS/YnhG family)
MFYKKSKCKATTGILELDGKFFPYALGRSGIIPANLKKEGDGATPEGTFFISSEILYRPDRIAPEEIHSNLPLRPILLNNGWCDDPDRPEYNQPVTLPFEGSHEVLYRVDHVYDLIIPILWNQECIPGKGSAIFIHLARQDLSPTRGCIAFHKKDLLELIPLFSSNMQICIQPEGISFLNSANHSQNLVQA